MGRVILRLGVESKLKEVRDFNTYRVDTLTVWHEIKRYSDTQNIFRSPMIYSDTVHDVCTEYTNKKFLFLLVDLVSFF